MAAIQRIDMTDNEWPLYEVFIRSKSGLSHRHAGSIHAADDQIYRHPTFYDVPDGVDNL